MERGSGNFCSLANLWFANESARPLVFALCRLRRPSVPALRTACARASSRFAASNGQRSGRECIFTFRTALRFACAVFRACALRVLATSALRAFTFLQAFALQKMPEMTYTPSFLIRASFFRDFVNTLEISLPFGPRGAIFPKWKKFLPKWQDALQRG